MLIHYYEKEEIGSNFYALNFKTIKEDSVLELSKGNKFNGRQ